MDATANTLAQAQTLATTAAVSTATATAATAWDAIGIGPAVLFMALTGTALGLLMEPPGGGRGRLFALALIYTVVSAALAVLLAELLGIQRLAGVLAVLLAFAAQTTIQALRDAIKSRVRRTIGGESGIDDGMDSDRRARRRRDDDFGGTWKGD
jgi:hypothetical protein